MKYQFMNEISDSIEERPLSKGLSWFVLLLVVLFFFGFYSLVNSTHYIPNSTLTETGGMTQSVLVVSPGQK